MPAASTEAPKKGETPNPAKATIQPSPKPAAPPPGAVPAARPSSSPAPPVPSPAPVPAPPPVPAPTYRSLDDDLLEAATTSTGRGGRRIKDTTKTPERAPAPSTAPPAPAVEPELPAGPPAAIEAPSVEDDYLMVPPAPAKPAEPQPPKSPDEVASAGPLKAPELRAEYAKVKKRVGDLEKELAELKAKPPEAKAVDEPERKVYAEEIAGLKKQLGQMTDALKAVAYEQSEEFKTKYQKPVLDAWQEGVQLVTRLTVTDQEGNTRKGTPDDFERIVRESDDETAATMAQETFGANAFYVLAQRRDLQRINSQRVRALEEFRSTLSEREKQQAETAKKQQEEAEARRISQLALWKRFNAQAAEKYPQFFAPTPGDDQGNALLEKGFKDVDLAFSGAQELSEERQVQLHAAIRNRAAAFGRLVHQLQGKDAQIAELKKELEELKGSTPGDGQVPRDTGKPKFLSAEEEIEAAARPYR